MNGFCDCCGAKMKEYPHKLNKPMAQAIISIYKKVGQKPILISTMLSHNQLCNFQKLKHWRIVEKYSLDGDRKGGYWRITDMGVRFLKGDLFPHRVWTFRDKVVRYDTDKKVSINQLDNLYEYRDYYIDNARNV